MFFCSLGWWHSLKWKKSKGILICEAVAIVKSRIIWKYLKLNFLLDFEVFLSRNMILFVYYYFKNYSHLLSIYPINRWNIHTSNNHFHRIFVKLVKLALYSALERKFMRTLLKHMWPLFTVLWNIFLLTVPLYIVFSLLNCE